jgi:hypothetical protein
MPRTSTTVAVTGGGVAVVAVAIALLAAKSDTPIEIADGSIHFYLKDGFEVVAGNQIKAAKLFRHTQEFQVWDQTGTTKYETINVTNLNWTATSADSSVTAQRVGGFWKDQVPITSPQGTSIVADIAGDNDRFHYSTTGKFTPATLRFPAGQALPTCNMPVPATNSCTLTCPNNYCLVRIVYKK